MPHSVQSSNSVTILLPHGLIPLNSTNESSVCTSSVWEKSLKSYWIHPSFKKSTISSYCYYAYNNSKYLWLTECKLLLEIIEMGNERIVWFWKPTKPYNIYFLSSNLWEMRFFVMKARLRASDLAPLEWSHWARAAVDLIPWTYCPNFCLRPVLLFSIYTPRFSLSSVPPSFV